MEFNWDYFIHAGLISAALLIATFLRSKLRFLQKFLIPNSIIAGFILLPLYNFVLAEFGLDTVRLGEFAYHLLSISFIAMTLRPLPPRKGKKSKNIVGLSFLTLSQFGIQAIIGLLLTLLAINTFMPDLFHSFGYLLPLGFAQGPGQAFSIGEAWTVFGIHDAGNVGLTFAAIGFLLCSIGGIFLINYGVRKGWISKSYLDSIHKKTVRTGILPRGSELPVGAYQNTQSEAIDSLTLQVVLILMTYFLTFLFLNLLTIILKPIGPEGERLARTFWGISFIFSALTGLLVRKMMQVIKIDHILENRTLNRLSGISVDIMVTSAIAAISLVVVKKYWIPITGISLAGALATILTVPWMGSRVFTEHRFLRVLLIYGVSTGTLATGLALLRVLDPEFETPVATDYTYAAGITFALSIPLILTINLPARAYQTGESKYMTAAILVSAAYIIFTFIWYLTLAGKKSFAKSSSVWLKD